MSAVNSDFKPSKYEQDKLFTIVCCGAFWGLAYKSAHLCTSAALSGSINEDWNLALTVYSFTDMV